MSLKASTNLRDYWYPLSKTEHVGDAPISLHLLGEPLVLFKSGDEYVCFQDKCAHRSAPLSIGQVINGNLECKYHGWQYDKSGKVVHIPAKLPDREILASTKTVKYATAVSEGLIWVHIGENPDILKLPNFASDRNAGFGQPFYAVIDLDIDHSLMVENLLDPAHLPFTHDGTISKRSEQCPLQMDVVFNEDETYMYGDLEYIGLDKPVTRFSFYPPSTNRLQTEFRPGWKFEQTMHCVPLRNGHMRFIYREQKTFLNWTDKIPFWNWLQLKFSEKIVFQDYELLHGQQLRLNQGAKPWNSPIAVDKLPKTYRQWYQKTTGWFKKYSGDIEDLGTGDCGSSCKETDAFPEFKYSKQKGVNARCYEPKKESNIVLWGASAVTLAAIAVSVTIAARKYT